MALYEVNRTDTVAPGEFVSGMVIAAGAARARGAFDGHPGVDKGGNNLTATRMDVNRRGTDVEVINVYWDESPDLSELSTEEDWFQV